MNNEYKRVNMMQEKRWTNILKCDIMENITKLGDAEQRDRLAEMDVNFLNETNRLKNIKKSFGNYYKVFKYINEGCKDKMFGYNKI